MKKLLSVLTACILLFACTDKEPLQEGKMIMEGFIADGEPPVVMLHTSLVMANNKYKTGEIDAAFREHIINWGRVMLTDGTDTCILTGRKDLRYMPPYIYTTSDFVGQAGKTYTIEAKYHDNRITAQTQILPRKPIVDHIQVQHYGTDEVAIHLYIIDTCAIGQNKYAVFTRHLNEKQYLISMTGTVTKMTESDTIVLPVNRPVIDVAGGTGVELRFHSTDTINIALAALTDEEYDFWDTFTTQAFSSGYMFTPIYTNYPSNTSTGMGYFYGYNYFRYTLDLAQDSVYYCKTASL